MDRLFRNAWVLIEDKSGGEIDQSDFVDTCCRHLSVGAFASTEFSPTRRKREKEVHKPKMEALRISLLQHSQVWDGEILKILMNATLKPSRTQSVLKWPTSYQ